MPSIVIATEDISEAQDFTRLEDALTAGLRCRLLGYPSARVYRDDAAGERVWLGSTDAGRRVFLCAIQDSDRADLDRAGCGRCRHWDWMGDDHGTDKWGVCQRLTEQVLTAEGHPSQSLLTHVDFGCRHFEIDEPR